MRPSIMVLFAAVSLPFAAAVAAPASDYKLQTLEQAHAMFHSATNAAMYAAAARQYEFLVQEEGIRNGNLFYTLGNSWFMAGDPGRALLNYRRAELFMPNDPDLQHNLKAARKLRTDLIPAKESLPSASRLLGLHLNTPIALRWWLFAGGWILFWSAWLWMSRSPKKEARITTVATGLLAAALLASPATEFICGLMAQPGVITAREVLARKGNGTMYAPAFLEPLHSGTEFQTLEERGPWKHIRLADGQTCWIPAGAAEAVVLND